MTLDNTRPIRGAAVIAKVVETETGHRPSVRTIQRWIAKGVLPVRKPGGRTSPVITTRGDICRAVRNNGESD